MGVQVTILHNVTGDGVGRNAGFFGYQHGHALVPVFAYDETLALFGEGGEGIANAAFHLWNVGHEGPRPDPRAVVYRERGNRSLSVGDVVMLTIGGSQQWLACADNGWDHVQPPDFLVWASKHGTTALDPRQHPIPNINPPIPTRR